MKYKKAAGPSVVYEVCEQQTDNSFSICFICIDLFSKIQKC